MGVVSGSCKSYAKPSWQSLLGVPSDGVRDIPDVSLFAANGVWGHYYVYCFTDPNNGGTPCTGAPSTWSGAGGTSFASPIMAAIQALVNQKTASSWGNPNPTYYRLAAAEYGSTGNTSCNSTNGNGGLLRMHLLRRQTGRHRRQLHRYPQLLPSLGHLWRALHQQYRIGARLHHRDRLWLRYRHRHCQRLQPCQQLEHRQPLTLLCNLPCGSPRAPASLRISLHVTFVSTCTSCFPEICRSISPRTTHSAADGPRFGDPPAAAREETPCTLESSALLSPPSPLASPPRLSPTPSTSPPPLYKR